MMLENSDTISFRAILWKNWQGSILSEQQSTAIITGERVLGGDESLLLCVVTHSPGGAVNATTLWMGKNILRPLPGVPSP